VRAGSRQCGPAGAPLTSGLRGAGGRSKARQGPGKGSPVEADRACSQASKEACGLRQGGVGIAEPAA